MPVILNSLPSIPFGLKIENGYIDGLYLILIARTKESTFLFQWDGVSINFTSVRTYPNIELIN